MNPVLYTVLYVTAVVVVSSVFGFLGARLSLRKEASERRDHISRRDGRSTR